MFELILWVCFILGIAISLVTVWEIFSNMDNNMLGKGLAGFFGLLLFMISGVILFLNTVFQKIVELIS